MGIKDLLPLLRRECPEVFVEVELADLSGLRVAVDVSCYLYAFLRSAEGDGWLDLFVNLACALKKAGMVQVHVFDGKAVKDKELEQNKRREATSAMLDRMQGGGELVDLLERLASEFEDPDEFYDMSLEAALEDSEFDAAKVLETVIKILGPKRSLDFDLGTVGEIRAALRSSVRTFGKQTRYFTEAHKKAAKFALDLLGVPWIQAQAEAETVCCYMARKGAVDVVLSDDTDVLAYGAPVFLTKLKGSTAVLVETQSVLDALELDELRFRDMCILLGCDYNGHKRIAGLLPEAAAEEGPKKKKAPTFQQIGQVKVLDMIRAYGDIAKMEALGVIEDVEVCNYRRCRELLAVPHHCETSATRRREPDIDQLTAFLDRKTRIPLEYVLSVFAPAQVVARDRRRAVPVCDNEPEDSLEENEYRVLLTLQVSAELVSHQHQEPAEEEASD